MLRRLYWWFHFKEWQILKQRFRLQVTFYVCLLSKNTWIYCAVRQHSDGDVGSYSVTYLDAKLYYADWIYSVVTIEAETRDWFAGWLWLAGLQEAQYTCRQLFPVCIVRYQLRDVRPVTRTSRPAVTLGPASPQHTAPQHIPPTDILTRRH